MMGSVDVRDRVASSSPTPVPDDVADDLAKLNQEWREKRDTLRNAKKAGYAGGAPISAPAAPQADRKELQARDTGTPGDNGLAEAAACGRLDDCRRILSYTAPNVVGLDGTTPLCAAALWDQADVVRLLLEAAADPSLSNSKGQRPTALHAAALQEHGKICMMLLGARADPNAKDGNGVTPSDYASCSEAIWPQFAAVGCSRTSKDDLTARGIIRKVSTALELELETAQYSCSSESLAASNGPGQSTNGVLAGFSRPGSAYVLTSKHPPRPGSAAVQRSGSRNGRRPSGSPIDILAEGDESAEIGVAGYAGGIAAMPAASRTFSGNAAATGSLKGLDGL